MDAPSSLSKLKWPLGIVLGLAAAVALMPLLGGGKPQPPSTIGATLSDCDGALHELVIQYLPSADPIVALAYRDLLRQLPASVTVHVIVPDRAAFDQLARIAGATQCRLNPIVVAHPITCWARDRWLALHPAGESRAITVLSPRGEMGADSWPARKGDESVGESLAGSVQEVAAARSELYFDGGDFVCDNETAFVTPNVRKRNLQVTVHTEDELHRRLEHVLGLKVVLLKTSLDHHAGMYMMTLGNRRVMVGDPRMARAMLTPGQADALPLSGGPDFSDATAAAFDTVADQCRQAGYEVIRVPIAPGGDGRTYLTYLNVILDEREGGRIVYKPRYDGADALNAAAAEVWMQAGFEVRAVDCTACYRHFGSLRCLVSVLRRG